MNAVPPGFRTRLNSLKHSRSSAALKCTIESQLYTKVSDSPGTGIDRLTLTTHETFGEFAKRSRQNAMDSLLLSQHISLPAVAANRSAILPRPHAKSSTDARSGAFLSMNA